MGFGFWVLGFGFWVLGDWSPIKTSLDEIENKNKALKGKRYSFKFAFLYQI
jgi:hypothetical protein